jgi:hypothetical protein
MKQPFSRDKITEGFLREAEALLQEKKDVAPAAEQEARALQRRVM